MSTITLTLRKSFFDDLWPLILWENRCETRSRNYKLFVPERRFDNMWAHMLLADKGYQDYLEPIKFHCCPSKWDREEVERKEKAIAAWQRAQETAPEDEEGAQSCLYIREPYMEPIDQRMDTLACEHQERQKLAYDYVHRKHPWYMQKPVYEGSFEIAGVDREKFVAPLEMEVLRQINVLNCQLIIIDVNAHVRLTEIEQWVKFCHYARIVVVVRNELMARRLATIGDTVAAVYLGENLENTWQEELCAALQAGVTHAKQLHLLDDCSKCFMFVFAKARGGCKFDTYKFLRKY